MKKLNILIVITLLVIGGIIGWWYNGTLPVNAQDKTIKVFVVQKGEGIKQIGYDLKNQGLIRDAIVFFALVKQLGLDGKVEAGNFQLSPSMTPQQIAETMTKGTLDVWVTIPEGKRATEIAQILQSKIPTYTTAWNVKLVEEEGYLFPDTYLFPKDADVASVISIMKNNFSKKYQEASEGATSKLSQGDVVTLASVVEREGRSPDEMKQIAAVLLNRLNIGMALQADATIQYAVGNDFNWWPTPNASQLSTDSPYNTYRNPGLPPTPISNPGLDALTAVLHPINSPYLYYFTDGKGVTHFAKTLDEQNNNIAKYGL